MVVTVRSAYDYDTAAASKAAALVCKDPSLTQQHMADECDINTIVKRFGLTGTVPAGVRMPTYGDFTGVGDYQSALHAVMAADEAFMSLPPDLRSRFGNDPSKFVDFCSDSGNLEELRKMGLAKPAEPSGVVDPAPVKAEPGAGGAPAQ